MWQAHLKGMADGDYVFITFELFPSDWWGRYKEFTNPSLCKIILLLQTLTYDKYANMLNDLEVIDLY